MYSYIANSDACDCLCLKCWLARQCAQPAASPPDCYPFLKSHDDKACTETGRSFCSSALAIAEEHNPVSSTHTACLMIAAAGVATECSRQNAEQGYSDTLPGCSLVLLMQVPLRCLCECLGESVECVWAGCIPKFSRHQLCSRTLLPAHVHRPI